jgi:hypothetical protein
MVFAKSKEMGKRGLRRGKRKDKGKSGASAYSSVPVSRPLRTATTAGVTTIAR